MTRKLSVRWACVASVLWLLAAGAAAQGPRQAQQGREAGDGPQRMVPEEQRPEQASPRDVSEARHNRRLSPEERRQLRRDVHEAGRDLYPERNPKDRRESRRP